MEQGLIHIYCGDGKGKTTAAVGLAIRAAGSGKKVLFTQFMKGGETGEVKMFKCLSDCQAGDKSFGEPFSLGVPFYSIKLLRSEKKFPFYCNMNDTQKKELTKIHNRILDDIIDNIEKGQCDVLVLDEITYPYEWNLLDKEKISCIFEQKEGRPEIVCTGRNPDAFFVDRADYITEMKCIRHPFEAGIEARVGIEY